MGDTCKTIKVKPWGKGQGEFVEINECDFDPAVHVAYDASAVSDGDDDKGDGNSGVMKIAEIRAALTAKGVAFDLTAKKADLLALLQAQPAT